MILRAYQSRLVSAAKKALKKHHNTLAIAATGAGKTIMLAALAKEIGGKTLVLQHRQELVAQNASKFRIVNPNWSMSFFDADRKSWAGDVTFAMQQTLTKNIATMPAFDHVIIDECFPAGTMVSGKRIDSIIRGDVVESFDERTGRIYKRQVTNVFRNHAPSTLVKIVSNGYNVVSTKSHPYFTSRGWVEAQNIRVGDYVYREMHMVRDGVRAEQIPDAEQKEVWKSVLQAIMRHGIHSKKVARKIGCCDGVMCVVRNGVQPYDKVSENPIQDKRPSLLQKRMWDRLQVEAVQRNHVKDEQEICFGADDQPKPDEKAGSERKGLAHVEVDEPQAARAWGEREGGDCAATGSPDRNAGSSYGIRNENKDGSGVRVPVLLQNRLGPPVSDDCDRDRRVEPQLDCPTREGHKEGIILGWQRVDNVEIHEQTSSSEFREMRGDGYVYNIEVEGLHTYLANGFVVHNCHHTIAPTYSKIIEAAQEKNKKVLLSGFTATPERGDRASLRRFFNNVSGKITIRELVGLGFLVPPRAFVVDVGVRAQLDRVKSPSAFGDQHEVADIMNTRPINEEVVRHWKERAGDRKTIVFCSTVQHARDVEAAFVAEGVNARCVHGMMSDAERKGILSRFDRGEVQVVTNVAILTEGYDSQPVSCIVLLRQCSEKGPMVQMAGRGLRTVDPEKYPDVAKKDCILLDFGTSILTHGNLDQEDGLHEDVEKEPGEATYKTCPDKKETKGPYMFPDMNGATGCGSEVPGATRVCPICGFVFRREDGKDMTPKEVSLMEMDILNASPFRWTDLFGTDLCLLATGFEAWAGIFSPDQGETWMALGGVSKTREMHKLAITGRPAAMAAADDFLREHETEGAAKKSKRWLNDPASTRQLEILRDHFGYNVNPGVMGSMFTKYAAACHSTFNFNRRAIERAMGVGA